MKSDRERISDLEMRLQMMQRQLAAQPTRDANPLSIKNGWWVAKLDGDLLAGLTATASIWAWNDGAWVDTGTNVEVQDYFLDTGDQLDAGTKIEVAWHRNVWTWRAPSTADDPGIPFRNDSGYTVPPGGIMYWHASEFIAATEYALIFRPQANHDRFWLVNGEDPVAYGDFGTGHLLFDSPGPIAWYAGPAGPPAIGESWGPKPGSFLAHFEYPGFTIMDTETATIGSQNVVSALQHQINKMFVRLYDELTKGGEAECEILHYRDGSWRVAPFDRITARDIYLLTGETKERGTKGEVTWWTHGWVGAFSCDKEDDDGVEPAEMPESAAAMPEPVTAFGPDDFEFLPEDGT